MVATRTATKNQLLGRLDRAFPGLTLALPDVLATKIGRLVAAEFADPARLAGLGVNRLIRFAATRDLQLRRPVAERLVAAARDALPTRDAAIARQILAADLVLLADLDDQIRAAETALESLLPHSPYATLTSVPGWGWCEYPITLPPWVIRAGGRGRGRSIARQGCPRCSMNPPTNAATAASAAKAVWRCAAL